MLKCKMYIRMYKYFVLLLKLGMYSMITMMAVPDKISVVNA